MYDNTESTAITTADPSFVLPSEPSDLNVSLYLDELGFIDGTIEGGDSLLILESLELVKKQQIETNTLLTNISSICLLYVALLGILIAQGFLIIFKKR